MIGWWRSRFETLDGLPDKPRVGVNLMIAGLAVVAVRYVWPLVDWRLFGGRARLFIMQMQFSIAIRSPAAQVLRI
jgi:hypothetical protein